jgi:hypothetical protein
MNPMHQAKLSKNFNIVVWDPSGEYWEGSLVDGDRARQLSLRGVVVLPVVPEFFQHSGVGGYARRAWGAGWPLDSGYPKLVAPLTLYCMKTTKGIHWAIRLVTDSELAVRARSGESFAGVLRFSADRSQHTPFYAGITDDSKPRLVNDLGPPDAHDGWTILGSGNIMVPQEGHYGFGVYAMAPGLRVAWVAASVTET